MKQIKIITIILIAIMSLSHANAQTNKLDSTRSDSLANLWSVYQGENNGKIMLIRKNNGCEKFVADKRYSVRCGIALKFLLPTDNGLPQIQKETALYNIEEDIFKIFQSDLNFIVTLIITTSGFREYVLYTSDVNKFEIRFVALKVKYPEYTMSSYSEKDEGWATYKSFGN